MRRPVVRFALACLLFLGWMGYLIYLAATTARPAIVSRPQVLVADLVVSAHIGSLDGPVKVQEVLLVNGAVKVPAAGDTIEVDNLRECKRLQQEEEDVKDVPLDWKGPGVYLLPLRQWRGQTYQVVVVPPSPGFPPRRDTPVRPTPRLYPVNEDTLRQVRSLDKQ